MQTESPLAVAHSNIVTVRRVLKTGTEANVVVSEPTVCYRIVAY